MTTISLKLVGGNRLTRRVILTLAVVGMVLLLVGFGGVQLWKAQQAQRQRAALAAPPQIGVTSVGMHDLVYDAPTIQVAVGTTVTWTNGDSAEHDVIFLNGTPGGPLLAQGQQYRHTFSTPGVYNYVCSKHSFMVGKVTVTR